MTGATTLAVAGTLLISASAGALYDMSTTAADDLRARTPYIEEVGS